MAADGLKKFLVSLFRDPAKDHPELEQRIDQHLHSMTKFSALIAVCFWPIIIVIGFATQLSHIRLLLSSIAVIGLFSALITLSEESRKRLPLSYLFYLVFPAALAIYVSDSFSKMLDAGEKFFVSRDRPGSLVVSEDQFLYYIGMFDRLFSVNFFFGCVLAFIALAPLKFRRLGWLLVPYASFGVLAFSNARKMDWFLIYLFTLFFGAILKAVSEYIVVQNVRRQLAHEEQIRQMNRAIIERDLQLARDIQQSLPVPKRLVTERYEIEFYLRAHDLVGGDWLAVRGDESGNLYILIVDAVGKGLQASLVVHAIQSLWTAGQSKEFDVENWIRLVNDTMCNMGVKTPHCVTLGVLELNADRIVYWSAAHCPILLSGQDGEEEIYREIYAQGGMIGLTKELQLTPREIDVTKLRNAHVILCSDGLLELLPRSRSRRAIFGSLKANFDATLESLSALDDLTVVSIVARHDEIVAKVAVQPAI